MSCPTEAGGFKLICADIWGYCACIPIPIGIFEGEEAPEIFKTGGTINDWLSEQITNAIIALADGIQYLADQLADARGKLVQGMVDAIKDPKHGGLALLGIFLTVTVLSIALTAVKGIAEVQMVMTFISGIGTAIKDIMSFMKVDLLITLVRLGGLFNERWHEALSKIYTSLGAVSMQLATDFSYINVFAEVNRSLLVTAYSLSGNAWIESQARYAEGLTKWLGGVEGKLGEYTAHPEKVFTDLQKEISEGHQDQTDKDSAKIWSAIDKAAEWIETSGNTVLDEIDYIETKMDELPQELHDAIMAHVQPYLDKLDDFTEHTWLPFWNTYHEAQGIIADYIEAHDISIKEIKNRIANPADWLDTLLLLKEGDSKRITRLIWEGITRFFHADGEKGRAELTTTIKEIIKAEPVKLPEPVVISEPVRIPVSITMPPKETVLGPISWFVGEGADSAFLPGAMPTNGNSWFVGE